MYIVLITLNHRGKSGVLHWWWATVIIPEPEPSSTSTIATASERIITAPIITTKPISAHCLRPLQRRWR